MTNKKLGLLLAPLIPLTAIGIVEVANELVSLNNKPAPIAIATPAPRVAPAPMPAPAPAPVPDPVGPRTVTAE